MRDDILRRTPGLRDLTCENIFGAGGDAKLSVNALWPDPVHRLLKYAFAKHKQLGHLRPIVKNLTVFLRPTKNGPLLPVTCEADIDALTPRQSCQPSIDISRTASTNAFTACHINVNGLFPSHFSLFEAKIFESRFDAIAIDETKINPLAGDSHLALDGFTFFHVDRKGMGGAGVGFYVRDTYSIEILCTSDPIYDNSPEFIICEIKKDQLRLLFAAVYRRPHAS